MRIKYSHMIEDQQWDILHSFTVAPNIIEVYNEDGDLLIESVDYSIVKTTPIKVIIDLFQPKRGYVIIEVTNANTDDGLVVDYQTEMNGHLKEISVNGFSVEAQLILLNTYLEKLTSVIQYVNGECVQGPPLSNDGLKLSRHSRKPKGNVNQRIEQHGA